MLRVLTKDAGRFKAGSTHDWPLTTWNAVAKDAGFKSLEAFTKEAPEAERMVAGARKGGKASAGQARATRH